MIERFQRREGLNEMIKGVIFDSGSADPLNPKVIIYDVLRRLITVHGELLSFEMKVLYQIMNRVL